MLMSTIIPAQPGFKVISSVENEDGSPSREVRAMPVIAWDVSGSTPIPITPEGPFCSRDDDMRPLLRNAVIEWSDGTVHDPEIRGWPNRSAWIEARNPGKKVA
jgi:hypothetical protein